MNLNKKYLTKDIENYIPSLQGYSSISHIKKGYANDSKFRVSLQDGRDYLLKIFDLKDFQSKQLEYNILQKMKLYNVKCSTPIEIGEISQKEIGYMILSYIDGDDAEEILPKNSEEVQYNIGFQAGQELLKMHNHHAPDYISNWYERKYKKHQNYIEQYRDCGYQLKHDSKVMSFIDDNIEFMKNRPNLFQHDDFHIGNLIIKDYHLNGVIDFNSFDWGDPVHDFLKVGLFSSEVSVPFSIGQIKGYHNDKEPDELFWRLYSLYLAMSMFSSIVWILKVKPDELDQMLNKLYRVLEDHDYFTSIKPRWYHAVHK